jgi:hypothetical protein
MVIMCEPVQSTCAGTCVARRPTGAAFRCDDHGLDDAQQELNEFVDGVVIIIQCSPVNVVVLQDGSTACNPDLGQASLTPPRTWHQDGNFSKLLPLCEFRSLPWKWTVS